MRLDTLVAVSHMSLITDDFYFDVIGQVVATTAVNDVVTAAGNAAVLGQQNG